MQQSNSNNLDGNNVILPPNPKDNVNDDSPNSLTKSEDSDSTIASPPSESLSQEEIRDHNKIHVVISDKKSPIVVLFGPKRCGKTMTLIRLTRYLKGDGYKVEPRGDFRPSTDKKYGDLCENFDTMVNNNDAAQSTTIIDFLLIRVLRNGKPLCQILEGPGELYFDPTKPKDPFPAYLNIITDCNNRKIWLIMLEPYDPDSGMDNQACRNYVDKIANLKKRLTSKDKVVFVFNKIDKTDAIIRKGQVNYSAARTMANEYYPNIFDAFKNQNPITKLWKSYNCDFIAFQTGTFTKSLDEKVLTFQEGPDIYPKKLWKLIYKRIIGGWL